jgi:hypothetical protein
LISISSGIHVMSGTPPPEVPVSPEASGLALRLAVRAFAWGTVLAVTSFTAGCAFVAYKMDVHSLPEFSAKMRTVLPAEVDRLNKEMNLDTKLQSLRSFSNDLAERTSNMLVPLGEQVRALTARWRKKGSDEAGRDGHSQ